MAPHHLTSQVVTTDTCNELAPTLRASALFLGRPMLADAWLRAVNASGLGSSPVSYTAFLSVQWALNPDGCQTTYNRIFNSYTPLAAPRPADNTTQCCGFCKVAPVDVHCRPCHFSTQDNAACSVWIYHATNKTCVLALQASVYNLNTVEGVSVGFVGNTLDTAVALYHVVPGLWCPEQLVRAGEVNTMLGNVTNTSLPIFITSSASGLVRSASSVFKCASVGDACVIFDTWHHVRVRHPQVSITGINGNATRSTNINGQGIIARSVKACNSIFHIMAGDFYYQDMPAEV